MKKKKKESAADQVQDDPETDAAKYRQVAALCYRDTEKGRRVLLITSRDTGRWIVPKGWPIEGKKSAETALIEAWEEAGVRQHAIFEGRIGSFSYEKGMPDDSEIPVTVQVFGFRVAKLADSYPEAHERDRKWVSPAKAAEMVQEPGLQEILRRL